MTDKTHRTWGYDCFVCGKGIRLRRTYLYDEEQGAHRCQSCWNLYIEKEKNNELETTI
jgi:hypothetical protein